MYNYKLTSTKDSSSKFGNCEICNKPVTEVFHQTETKEFTRPDGSIGNTLHNCIDLYGHKECLINKRRSKNDI